jgi:voltage-gated potassium channel
MHILIFFTTLAIVLETEEGLYSQNRTYFQTFDTFSIVVFSVEYIFRLWTCIEHEKYRSPISGLTKGALSTSMLIDQFSFLPFDLFMDGAPHAHFVF